MITVYIREYIGEFKTQEEAENYLDNNAYAFDEFKQPMFVETGKE